MTANPKTPFSKSSSRSQKLRDWLMSSGFLFGAILLHVILFLMVATYIIFPAPAPLPDFSFNPVNVKPPPPPPPQPPAAAGGGANNNMEPSDVVTPPSAEAAIAHITAPSDFSMQASTAPVPSLPDSYMDPSGVDPDDPGAPGLAAGMGNPFGTATGSNQTLQGTLYDFTMTQDGKPTTSDLKTAFSSHTKVVPGLPGVGKITTGGFQSIISDFIKQLWQPDSDHPCYISPNKIFTQQIFVPVLLDKRAGAAFKSPMSTNAFWLVHYQAKVASNTDGRFRFIGFGDNVLIVALDGNIVLDASDKQYLGLDSMTQVGGMKPGRGSPTPLIAGNWFDLEQSEYHKIDILIGDEGGTTDSGLFIQPKTTALTFATDGIQKGAPKIPLFVIGSMSDVEKKSLSKFLPPECLTTTLSFNGQSSDSTSDAPP